MKAVLGTMTFGPQVSQETGELMIQTFVEKGYSELDTAHVYNNGETELILGKILNQLDRNTFSIATKVHPRITGKLDGEAIHRQFYESLERMSLDYVDTLYFHFPDPITPIENALEKCAELYEQGKFKELGLSNFPLWMVVNIWHLCDKNGWPKPTIYQGMYNGLCRNVEPELMPSLRKFGIRFYAFNPLAGGLLTGKHQDFDEKPQLGRFARLESYRKRYWKQNYFEAVQEIADVCNKFEIKPAEAAFRWLIHHSLLNGDKGDAIIIGASKISQFDKNIRALGEKRLPSEVVEAFDLTWDKVLYESPEYFRFFTKL